MKTATPHLTYRADIDGLRALAVLSVVGFHAFPSVIQSGFVGVDIFFVISGFLISSILFKGLTDGSFGFWDFYCRRVKRIFPALLLVLATCFVIGWFVLLPDEYQQLGKHISAGAGFASNFVLLGESGYFDNLSDTKPLLHLWSLGIEEQFYFVWPLLLWLAWKKKFNPFILIATVALVSLVLNVTRISLHSTEVFYTPQTRFWELLIGSGLAYLLHESVIYKQISNTKFIARLNPYMSSDALSLVGAALVILSVSLITKDKQFPGWWAFLPTLGAALIIGSGAQTWLSRKVLSTRLLVWFGLISFPLYLWHWPLLAFARIMEGETPSLEIRIAAVILSVGLAWLTYVAIEKPLRFGEHSTEKAIALFISMILMGVIGYNCFSRDGYRFRAGIKALELQSNAFKWGAERVQVKTNPTALTLSSHASNGGIAQPEIDAVLIGDSHAEALFVGLFEVFKKHGLQLQLKAGSGLPPFYDLTVQFRGQKVQWEGAMNGFIENAIKDEAIKTVILSSRGPLYTSGHGFGDVDPLYIQVKPKFAASKPNEDGSDVFSDAMSRTLAMLTLAKKNIFFVVDIAELGFDPKQCVDLRPVRLSNKSNNACVVPKADYLKRNSAYLEIISHNAKLFPNVVFLYPSKYLCDDLNCYAKKESLIIYRDNNHLSHDGSLYLGSLLEKDIFQ